MLDWIQEFPGIDKEKARLEGWASPCNRSAGSRGRAGCHQAPGDQHRQGRGPEVWGPPGPQALAARPPAAVAQGHHCSSAAAARHPSGNEPKDAEPRPVLSSGSPAPAALSASSALPPPVGSWCGLRAAGEMPGQPRPLGLGREKRQWSGFLPSSPSLTNARISSLMPAPAAFGQLPHQCQGRACHRDADWGAEFRKWKQDAGLPTVSGEVLTASLHSAAHGPAG